MLYEEEIVEGMGSTLAGASHQSYLQAAGQVRRQRDLLGFTHGVCAFAEGAVSGESVMPQPPPMAL